MQHTKRLAFAVEMRSPTSGDEDDDQYGSEAQVETQEKMGSELSHKYQGPEWDGKKESYTEWRWEATPYLDSLGLESVRRGRNRSVLTTSASSKEAVTMVIALNKLFRVILRMIKRDCPGCAFRLFGLWNSSGWGIVSRPSRYHVRRAPESGRLAPGARSWSRYDRLLLHEPTGRGATDQ